MKSAIFSFCLSVVCTTALHARTWIVDNDISRPADFRTAQAAHDGAAVGDTLLFVGSGTNYNTLDLSKRLNIEGPGYDLLLNGIASANTSTATFFNITISAGNPIVAGGGASNSTFKGIVFASMSIKGGVNGLMLDQVKGDSIGTTENSNSSDTTGANYHVTGLVVRRSTLYSLVILGGSASVFNCRFIDNPRAAFGLIRNPAGTPTPNQATNFKGASLACSQSILGSLTDNNFSDSTPSTAVFTNCICLGLAPVRSGRTVNGSVLFRDAANYPGNRTTSSPTAYSEVFVGASLPTEDSHFKLNTNPSNPALGAGVGGGDAGMFAGAQPYKLSGIPARPRVTYLNSSGVVSDTVGLNVQAGGEVRP